MRIVRTCFLLFVWLILVFPFASMSFRMTTETTENKILTEFPAIRTEKGWNYKYLQELGAFFEDHFAFRPEMVDANAVIQKKVFHYSASNQVIVGKNNWLYYSGTLKDYLGTDVFNQRQWYALEHNLSLMQQYIEGKGSQFLFVVVPNKNSLYSGNMPYYYKKGVSANRSELQKRMEDNGIHYLDLFAEFSHRDDILYYARDTHWNTTGALLGYNMIMDAIDKTHETYRNVPPDKQNHLGDIDSMLYPVSAIPENDVDYLSALNYHYINDVTNEMDEWIETENHSKQGTLLMYRDSFGEKVLPFLADNVEYGFFSRLVPYNLAQIEQYKPDYVIIERAERELKDFVEKAAVMEPDKIQTISCPQMDTDSSISMDIQGSWVFLEGTIEHDYIDDNTDIFISIRDDTGQTKTYPVFYTVTDKKDGYQVYLMDNSIDGNEFCVNTIICSDGKNRIVSSKVFTIEHK